MVIGEIVYKRKSLIINHGNIPADYMPIYSMLSNEPIHINEIAKKMNKSVQEITPILTIMEIERYVSQVQTNYFINN